MKVGMSLPSTVDGIWDPPEGLEQWARAIDDGPFASMTIGSRVAGDSPDLIAVLGAVAAWTRRVEIVATVTPQLYDPVLLAKALASVDRISRGRLTVAIGVGGREDDYRALGVDLRTQNNHQLVDRARRMQWVWRGDHLTDTVRAVGPPPVRAPGPQLLMSIFGPQAVHSGAEWADGVLHVLVGPGERDVSGLRAIFDEARSAWAEAGRPAPRLTTSLWFAVDEASPDGGRRQIDEHVRSYLDWAPEAYVDDLLPHAGYAGPAAGLGAVLERLAEAGAHEVNLIPTSTDLAQVGIVADALRQVLGKTRG